MTEEVLELLGEVCPIPLLKTESEINTLTAGDRLIIKVDHTQAVRNIMDWCEDNGYEFNIDEVAPGIWKVEIIKL
ncbi:MULTISPECIES: sulfurtransferase TusA family protein [unclassified Candidatus Frackibacter]|uniref:sulfurtransferase TusA family protein n=1 Tax=unclassified Candidatus Frackibacter TaxID=2648818 RepID=UPI0007969147|nr:MULTISPECIES: sulfurtransferase TusA family protein [unclassified Candidatus Frackibacter]KXS45370.1 MAG: SirA family protein [Candidatus Frackibacter sp. T328-2]SDC78533.1 Sulfurtransferase TusA [Candidatus Frackibacter sp. WG11]SEM91365.1 Sulfurtransferase TusA [Candidatus Frackibacter sp. WG12]SFM01155.1 Sulfurtransferase TusA [Candidatus Frackibacter sp. WG13]